MTENISLARAKAADADAIYDINRRCFGYTSAPRRVGECIQSVQKNPLELALLARIGDNVIGYCHAQIIHPMYGGRTLYIHALAVSPEYRRRGAGGRLLSECEEWGRRNGATVASLHSGVDRRGAHAFYASRGYSLRKETQNLLKPLIEEE